jgi:hypothetical protein
MTGAGASELAPMHAVVNIVNVRKRVLGNVELLIDDLPSLVPGFLGGRVLAGRSGAG